MTTFADAMAEAAREVDVPIRWGAAWTVPNIAQWDGTMEDAINDYIDTRSQSEQKPFIRPAFRADGLT